MTTYRDVTVERLAIDAEIRDLGGRFSDAVNRATSTRSVLCSSTTAPGRSESPSRGGQPADGTS
jgi:hypothetical protein